jgi:signal transduction histidine kinase
VDQARAPLLRTLIRSVAMATGLGVLVLGPSLAVNHRWVELGAGVAVSLLYLALDRLPLPFRWRAGVLLGCWGVGGSAMMVATGITMGPAFAGFVLPVLAALFMGRTATVLAFGWSLASLVAVGLLGQAGILTAPTDPAQARLAYQHWPLLAAAQGICVGPVVLVAQRLLASLEQGLAERERLIAELRAAQRGLAETERVRTLGLLAGGVVHDLNNTLTAIAAEVDLASGLPEESRAAMSGLVQAAGQLAAQVLHPAGKVSVDRRAVDLNVALKPALGAIRRMLPGGVDFQVEAPLGPLPVLADPALLQQALLNLAVNARDAIQGEGRLSVTLGRTERGGRACARVEVRDTGQGMDAATLARAGEPFFTTKEPGRGTGLGLSNVRRTVQQHGGELEVASTPGAGTQVSFWLPLDEAAGG